MLDLQVVGLVECVWGISLPVVLESMSSTSGQRRWELVCILSSDMNMEQWFTLVPVSQPNVSSFYPWTKYTGDSVLLEAQCLSGGSVRNTHDHK